MLVKALEYRLSKIDIPGTLNGQLYFDIGCEWVGVDDQRHPSGYQLSIYTEEGMLDSIATHAMLNIGSKVIGTKYDWVELIKRAALSTGDLDTHNLVFSFDFYGSTYEQTEVNPTSARIVTVNWYERVLVPAYSLNLLDLAKDICNF